MTKWKCMPEMIECPAGTFVMGSPASEPGREGDETAHQVTLTRAFTMGRYPVTQALYEAVMGTNPAMCKGSSRPVEQVNWFDAVRFCNALSFQFGLRPAYIIGEGDEPEVTCDFTAPGYRLPTESEWEYACRAGTTTRHYSGDSDAGLGDIAWYEKNANDTTHPVGQKMPNAWGLYDMAGNVFEWTWDWYGTYPGATTDYIGPQTGNYRVSRGGSCRDGASYARAAYRNGSCPGVRGSGVGFRLARTTS